MTEHTITFHATEQKTALCDTAGPLDRNLTVPLCGTALMLGLLGDGLVFPEALGFGATVWCLAVLAGLGWYHHKETPTGLRAHAPLYALATLAALSLSWRDAPFLRYGNLVLFFFVIAWIQLAHTGLRLRQLPIFLFLYHLGGVALAWISIPFLQLRLLRAASPDMNPSTTRSLYRSLCISFVVLVLFGFLLGSADARFSDLLRRSLTPDIWSWLHHGLWISIYSVIALAVVTNQARAWGCWSDQIEGAEESLRKAKQQLAGLEVLVPMTALNLMFILFVSMQVGYLFGGEAYVQNSMGVTYADYARRGFFELATVAILILPMQMLFDWLLREEGSVVRRIYHYLGAVQAVLLLFMLLSAAHRMALYQEVYGLTQLRYYASAGIVWIGLCVVWHQVTVWQARRDRVVFGGLIAAMLLFFVVQGMNPDAYIAGRNIDRLETMTPLMDSDRPNQMPYLDVAYLQQLSADAIPTIVHRFANVAPQLREALVDSIVQGEYPDPSEYGGIRTWNWGTWRARLAVDGS